MGRTLRRNGRVLGAEWWMRVGKKLMGAGGKLRADGGMRALNGMLSSAEYCMMEVLGSCVAIETAWVGYCAECCMLPVRFVI